MSARPWPVITILAVIGFYISLDIGLFGGIVPNVLGAPWGLLLLVIHARRVQPNAIAALAGLSLLYLFSSLLAAVSGNGDKSVFLPAGQLIYSVVTVYGVFLDLSLWQRRHINRLMLILSVVVLVGCLLEVYTPFKMFTTQVEKMHAFVRASRAEAAMAIRDRALYGQLRPRLFTSESSYVAINFGIFVSIWLLTLPQITMRNVMTLAALLVTGLFLIRSPFVTLPLLIGGADLVFNRDRSKQRFLMSGAEVAAFMLISVVVIGVVAALTSVVFGSRAAAAQTGGDWSVIARTYGAIAVGAEVAWQHPVLGVGPGNFDAFQDTMAQIYLDLRVPEYVIRSEYLSRSLNNGTGAMMAFFGIFGSVAYIWLWCAMLKSAAPRFGYLFLGVLIFIVYMTAGNIYSPKCVWPQFLILAALMSSQVAPAVVERPRYQRGDRRNIGQPRVFKNSGRM